MKVFAKITVSRNPFQNGDKDIDGYFFKLNEELNTEDIKEILEYVRENADYAFMNNFQFGSHNLQSLHGNNKGDIAKTMFLLTQIKSVNGVPLFTIDKEYGVSKIRKVTDVATVDYKDGSAVQQEEKAAETINEQEQVNESVENTGAGEETGTEEVPAAADVIETTAPEADNKVKEEQPKKTETKAATTGNKTNTGGAKTTNKAGTGGNKAGNSATKPAANKSADDTKK